MNSNRVNQLLRAALNATSNGVLITDNTQEDNPIIYVNLGFEEMTGYETDEIIGHNCRFLQGEKTDRDDVTRIREAVKNGTPIDVELLNYKKDGTPFWNSLSIAPVKNDEGKVTHFVGVQADVTDRKEKEKAQRAQLMAENIVDTVREPIVILNENFTIHSANKSFFRTFETTPAQTIGKHLYEIEDGFLNVPALKSLLENILPQKNPFESFEISHDFPRVGKKSLILNARRLERDEERPEYILLAMEDVTRFKESETALFESERRSRLIIEGLSDLAVVTTDASGRITTWNAGAQNIFGYEENEILNQKIEMLFGSDGPNGDEFSDELNQAIQQGQLQRERWMKRKDQSQFWALSLLSALRDEAENFQGFAILIHDQSPRKQLQEQLDQRVEELATRDRAKDEFLAMLGHELRNPLAAISNAVDVAQMLGTQESLKRPLEIASRQIEQMNRLVGDLLDVARVTQGKVTLQNERLAFDEIIHSVVQTQQVVADAKKLKLKLKIKPRVFITGDALRIEQIVNNLVSNAIKYTEKGSVTVELRVENDQALFVVTDTGYGIDAQLLPRLFDLFSQADRTLARSEGGLGVGLTIVKQLVELHGGRIEAKSEGSDQGSTFIVRLPIDASSTKTNEEVTSEANEDQDLALRILVVEDNADVAEMFMMMLQLWNYKASYASDGEAAISIATEERPHVVLLDIGLPKLDGFQVAEQLRKQFTSEQMKLISLTGYAQREDEEKAMKTGFDRHLAKPVNFGLLRELLSKYEAGLKQGQFS